MSTQKLRIARAIAIAADVLQLGLFPLFAPGFASVLNDALDMVVCAAMIGLMGWSPLFLPTIAIEMVPFADLAPTWTVAYFLVARRRAASEQTRLPRA